jgi:hypothetical protein
VRVWDDVSGGLWGIVEGIEKLRRGDDSVKRKVEGTKSDDVVLYG